MKTFCIVYTYTVSEDVAVKAETKKEALEKFRQIHPDEKVTDIWEAHGEWIGV